MTDREVGNHWLEIWRAVVSLEMNSTDSRSNLVAAVEDYVSHAIQAERARHVGAAAPPA